LIPSKKKLVLAAIALSLSAPALVLGQMTATRVREGKLSGVRSGHVGAFLGVPYAAPPTGEMRWKPPAPASAWDSVRKADALPPSCQQTVTPNGFGPWTHEYAVANAVSEDCLYVNVWTPAKAAGAKLPVLVWIHGGAFTSGSASVPIYDGSALAAKGIVVIGINYRVGLYGFLAHPELTAESLVHASGNYGLLDQIAALKWIKANASAFGGDPSRITIAGQSAGAASVHYLISSPLAKGLFIRAIAQSGSGIGLTVPARSTAERTGVALAQAAGARTIADLRRMSPSELEAAAGKMSASAGGGLAFAPVVDGLVLTDAAMVGATTNDTPILTGMTADETTGLNPVFGQINSTDFKKMIENTYGPHASGVSALYPVANDVEAKITAAALERDRGLASMAIWAERRLHSSANPIYLYLWNHAEPGPDSSRYGAFHSSEIPYVFGTLDRSPERPFKDLDRRLSALLGSYWVNWVKTGNPNGAGLPVWPRYTLEQKQILEIGATTSARAVLPAAKLEVFERYVEAGGRLDLF
jgi:para-nitrobenzyl esterase